MEKPATASVGIKRLPTGAGAGGGVMLAKAGVAVKPRERRLVMTAGLCIVLLLYKSGSNHPVGKMLMPKNV